MKNDQCCQIKCSSNCPITQAFLMHSLTWLRTWNCTTSSMLETNHTLTLPSSLQVAKCFSSGLNTTAFTWTAGKRTTSEKRELSPSIQSIPLIAHNYYYWLCLILMAYYTLTSNVCRFPMSPLSVQMHHIHYTQTAKWFTAFFHNLLTNTLDLQPFMKDFLC